MLCPCTYKIILGDGFMLRKHTNNVHILTHKYVYVNDGNREKPLFGYRIDRN